MKISELHTGEKGIIVKVTGRGNFRKRIIEMGFIRGKEVEVIQNAPFKDPIHYKVMDYDVTLRRSEAELIEIIKLSDTEDNPSPPQEERLPTLHPLSVSANDIRSIAMEKGKIINVALVGNPNCGKTSLFNMASGAHEHTGNYAGVTVDAKLAVFKQNGYTFRIIDLPGTYSLSPYSPEELYVRQYLSNENPDVVINVVDASNLERNFYLTTQLIDMDMRIVIALNMYDELQKQGAKLDCRSLSELIGAPVSPTVGRTGEGIKDLFDRVIRVYEGDDPAMHHIHINYGEDLETGITHIRKALMKNEHIGEGISKRLLAIRLLEKDKETETFIHALPNGNEVLKEQQEHIAIVENLLKEDTETALTDARYGFIAGALKETYSPGKTSKGKRSEAIDAFVTHKYLGYPIFLLFMFLMFSVTFLLGKYPEEAILNLLDTTQSLVATIMPDGVLKDLLVEGIIKGVGSVLKFLPYILLLYLFISFMEDTGYMSRAVFIMDKLMHKMGLHGRSFISLVMGFGCNVPAIMSTRAIESRNSRAITILVNPLMSCNARMIIYVLLAGSFFPDSAPIVIFLLYLSGMALAVLIARLFKRILFKEEDLPFVMELPPYRLPTLRSILIHMWEKAKQFLRKMGGVILAAAIIIWFLSNYPKELDANQQPIIEKTYIGQVGNLVLPVFKPLGFDMEMSIATLSGFAAKEVITSTLERLYPQGLFKQAGEDTKESKPRIQALLSQMRPDFKAGVWSFMFFIMLYFPCTATIIAISKEAGSWKWGAFAVIYTCALAYLVAFIVYNVASLPIFN